MNKLEEKDDVVSLHEHHFVKILGLDFTTGYYCRVCGVIITERKLE